MDDSNVDAWGAEFEQTISHIDFSPIFPQIIEIVEDSIDLNFSEGGRFGGGEWGGGTTQWIPSQRALRQGRVVKGIFKEGMTLADTSHLRDSIRVNISQQGTMIVIMIGSNLDYAAIHQYGGDITHGTRQQVLNFHKLKSGKKKGRTRFAKESKAQFSQKVSIGAATIHIVARPYLVVLEEDIQAILKLITEYIFQYLSTK